MNIEKFLKLHELAKLLKKDYVLVNDNYIIGTDENFATCSIIYTGEVSINTVSYAYKVRDISNLIKSSIADKLDLILTDYCIFNSDQRLYFDPVLLYSIRDVFSRCTFYKNTDNILQTDNDIRTDEFNEILSMKAANGSKLFNINNTFLLSTFNTIHPVTKTDKMGLVIYGIDNRSFLCEFIITKKKCIIYEYLRYRYI